jgi:hypothetical protein
MYGYSPTFSYFTDLYYGDQAGPTAENRSSAGNLFLVVTSQFGKK